MFGPAAIVSVRIGAGETIVVVRAGAWARYGLLWLVLLSCVVKGIFVTYLLGRYATRRSAASTSATVWCGLPGPRGRLLETRTTGLAPTATGSFGGSRTGDCNPPGDRHDFSL